MVSLDLKDAYLQVPMHPDSRKFLRFMVGGKVYQFKVLCFGLSTAPQVCIRVMAPVSAILHRMGVRLCRYLDDWLLQASSREQVLLALKTVLRLCRSLGIVVNWEKSQVIPTQQMVYLGVILDSTTFRASPALKRVEKLLSIGDVFLSCISQPASSWLELLGVLSSMIQLVPGGHLRMRSLQLALRRQWDHVDQSQLVEWSPVIRQDLSWWLDRDRLELGISLEQVSPQLKLWSDASDVGWGDSLRRTGRFWPLGSRRGRALDQCPRALGNRESSPVVCSTSRRFLGGGLRRQLDCHLLSEEPRRDSLFLSELHRSEDFPLGGGSSCGDFPAVHHGETQCPSGRSFSPEPNLGLRVDGEAGGLQGSVQEMASVDRPFCNISKSQMFDIFFSLPRSQCSGDGCPSKLEWVAGVCLSSLVTHSGGFEEAPVVLWGPADHHSSVLDSEAVISGSSRSGGRRSGRSSTVQGPSASASLPSVPSGSVQAVSSCLETIKRFTRAGGFSKHVAQQVSLACHPSSRAGYQSKWLVFRQWCRSEGHSISRPSLSKIADFLFWLRRSRQLSVSSIMGYRSMLSAVFKSILPEISSSPVLHDLLRSFQVEAPIWEVRPPAWDLPTVNYLRSSSFEPLYTISLRDLTRKTLFLISLATAKRVGELQALSRRVSFSSSSAGLSYVPEFVTKTESAICPLPRSFEVKSLGDFAACLPEDLLLCPVRSLSANLDRTSGLVNRPRCLFVSSKCPSRAMSKNCISYMLREVIVQSGASSQSGQVPRSLSIRGIAFSVTGLFGAFWRRPLGVRTRGFYIFLFAGFIL